MKFEFMQSLSIFQKRPMVLIDEQGVVLPPIHQYFTVNSSTSRYNLQSKHSLSKLPGKVPTTTWDPIFLPILIH